MRYLTFLIVILFPAIFIFSQNAGAQTSAMAANQDLPNFTQIDAHLYRGGKPTEAGMKELARLGVKTIINLRNDIKDRDEEALQAQRDGLKFVTVPLNIWFRPKDAQINKILATINESENQPVYVHCRLGADRTGMVIAVYRIAHDGWTAKQANEEAKQNGLGKWQIRMRDYISDYYRNFKNRKKSSAILNRNLLIKTFAKI